MDRDDIKRKGGKQEVKGAAKEAAGKVQKNVGDLTDDTSQQVKGKIKEEKGEAQKEMGRAARKGA
ncbi:hypothetical protein BH23GEM4_BH23GEM4_13900 [soil metagenome]